MSEKLEIKGGGGGASSFLGLSDTPDAYVGQTLKAVRVNAGETALEFVTFPSASPGGSDKQLQFNDGGVFGGAVEVKWDKTLKRMIFSQGAYKEYYNTADEVTNYERFAIKWDTNRILFASQIGGNGTARQFLFRGADTTQVLFDIARSDEATFLRFGTYYGATFIYSNALRIAFLNTWIAIGAPAYGSSPTAHVSMMVDAYANKGCWDASNVDGTNYERAFGKWDTDVWKMGTEAGGTGVVRSLKLYSAGLQVVGDRVIDARIDDAINSGDATTDGVIDAIRDALIAHGLMAAA